MTLYTVTASNRYFYMDLAVHAETPVVADKLFEAYLESQRPGEDEEYNMALAVWADEEEDGDKPNRGDFEYAFGPDDISDEGNLGKYTGEIGPEVVMTDCGGNG